jgi:hypothetical protein
MCYRMFKVIFICLGPGLLSFTAFSAELDWSIESAVGHTDNATLANSNEISDTIGSIGGHIELTRNGSRVDGRLRGTGSFRDYFDNTYDDDFLGSGDAELSVSLIGESVVWSVDDSFGQVLSDVFEPSTPDNRENANIFSTGPDIRLQLGSSTEMVIGGRFQNASYENSQEADNERISGTMALIRRTSPAVAWSMNVSASSVDYDVVGNQGYDQQEVFARVESSGANQTFSADLGIGFLDGGDQTEQTTLIRIDWTRQISPSWALDLGAVSEFANADDQFTFGISDGTDLGGTQDILLSGLAMRNDLGSMNLRFVRPRTRLRLFGEIGQETYPDTVGQDRDRWSLGIEANRRLTSRLETTFEFRHEDRDFDSSGSGDKTDSYSAQLDWRIGMSLFLGVEGRWEHRSGDTGSDYDEAVYLASVSYRPTAQ